MKILRCSSSDQRPSYYSAKFGQDHTPSFLSIVVLMGRHCFLGPLRSTKKESEQGAAEKAYGMLHLVEQALRGSR